MSATTVSHALNQRLNTRVADATRQRIEKTAREMGYSPNPFARALRTNRSYTLALLSDEIATTPYAGRLILGAQETASQLGYVLLIMTTGGDVLVEEREIETVWRYQVDGVLYAGTSHRLLTVPASLSGKPVYVVNAESADEQHSCIYPNEQQGGLVATRELTAAGHRIIGFVNTGEKIPARLGRLEGYRTALAEAEIPYRRRLVVQGRGSFAGDGYLAASKLLAQEDRPTALFCFNDRMAMGAYRAAHEMGLAIPRDLSIVGFDNQAIVADALSPPLTTVALPYYEMGAMAVEELVAGLDGNHSGFPPAKIAFPNAVVRRESVRRI